MRDGSPTKDSCNLTEGGRTSVVKQQFDATRLGMSENLLKHLNDFADFSIRKYNEVYMRTITEGTQSKYKGHKLQPGPYRRLEDIHPSDLLVYLDYAIIDIKVQREYISKDEYERPIETTFTDADGEETLTESALQEYRPSVGIGTLNKAKERIPYLLKQLHDYSKHIGYSMISLAVSYAKYKRNNVNSNKIIPPREVLYNDCYFMNEDGTLGERIMVNKNSGARAIRWIQGVEPDIYYEFAMELIDLVEDIGYPLHREDPTKYTEEFIESLVVMHVASNESYMRSLVGGKPVNNKIIKQIGTINLDDFSSRLDIDRLSKPAQTTHDKIERLALLTANSYSIAGVSESDRLDIEDVYKYYTKLRMELARYYSFRKTRYSNNSVIVESSTNRLNYNIQNREDIQKLPFMDGFFAYNSVHLWMIDLSVITDHDTHAILHSGGMFVKIRPDGVIQKLSIVKACRYATILADCERDGINPKDNYTDFGEWY